MKICFRILDSYVNKFRKKQVRIFTLTQNDTKVENDTETKTSSSYWYKRLMRVNDTKYLGFCVFMKF